MRSQYQLETLSDQKIEVYLAPPHQFFGEQQDQLIPNWKFPVTCLILFLQQSSISLKEINPQVTQEKDRLSSFKSKLEKLNKLLQKLD